MKAAWISKMLFPGGSVFKTCMIPRGLMSHLEDRTDLLIDQKYDHGYQHAFKQIKWRHSKHHESGQSRNLAIDRASHSYQRVNGHPKRFCVSG